MDLASLDDEIYAAQNLAILDSDVQVLNLEQCHTRTYSLMFSSGTNCAGR